MLNELHSLLKEFPQYKERIHELKLKDTHFTRLLEEYDRADKELYNIENEVETPSDAYIETLKKKRLKLKDELLAIIRKSAA